MCGVPLIYKGHDGVLYKIFTNLSRGAPEERGVVVAEAIWSMLVQKILQMFSFFLVELLDLLELFLNAAKAGRDADFLLGLGFFLSEFSRYSLQSE
jgi:hypothetical protein